MEFGPEIKVDGKRPEWLDPNQQIAMHDYCKAADGLGQDGTGWYGMEENGFKYYGREIGPNDDIIRLPANHPHYTTPTPDERAVALVKKIARSETAGDYTAQIWLGEARAIVAALEPVDVNLVEAREIVALVLNAVESVHNAECCIRGQWDNEESVQRIYAAIKRGRQLEKEGK